MCKKLLSLSIIKDDSSEWWAQSNEMWDGSSKSKDDVPWLWRTGEVTTSQYVGVECWNIVDDIYQLLWFGEVLELRTVYYCSKKYFIQVQIE